jgi:hypothetical protein
MILPANHTKESITSTGKTLFAGKDPQLVEKILKALSLLELLAQEKVEFTFKGGTSLLLLLGTPRRFSIDLDFVVRERSGIIAALERICKNNPVFGRMEEDQRPESKILKSHYKVFYQSDLSGAETYVLVDLIEDSSPYPTTIDSEIRPSYFQTAPPYLKVRTPTVNGILGDKLTAFAPRTTGIPLGVKKEMEIAKQLFDVASLYDHADDFSEVKKAFISVAEKEIKYRGLHIGYTDVLQDSFEAARIIASQGAAETAIFNELQSGIKKLKAYVLSGLSPVEVQICAAKTAYLTRVLQNDLRPIPPFKSEDMGKVEITNPSFNKLNKVKKVSPEAFYYWKATIDSLAG